MVIRMNYRYSHTIGFLSVSGRGFNNPVDLVLGDGGILYVLNRAGSDVAERMVSKRISICTVEEDYYGEFGRGGVAEGQMMWPSAMTMSAEGNLFISDEALNRISIFETDGGFVGSWGVQGRGKGELNRPSGIAFDSDGNLLVADGLNNRIQRFTPDGRYLGGWGRAGTAPGEFNIPWGIATDSNDNVFVADWRNDRIQKFDADGKPLKVFGSPGNGDGELHRPSGVTLDDDGNLYIADWGNHRVQILDLRGNFWPRLEAAPECPSGPMNTSAPIPTSWRSGRKQTWSLISILTPYTTRATSLPASKNTSGAPQRSG